MNGTLFRLLPQFLCATSILLAGQSLRAQSATFYVNYEKSPEPERSFRTVEEAQQAVRAFLKEQKQPGNVTVLIEGGTYYLAAPLTFTADDSPLVKDTIVTYKANQIGRAHV